jgi:hypothetical protein
MREKEVPHLVINFKVSAFICPVMPYFTLSFSFLILYVLFFLGNKAIYVLLLP